MHRVNTVPHWSESDSDRTRKKILALGSDYEKILLISSRVGSNQQPELFVGILGILNVVSFKIPIREREKA
jgi:hypothetical protein